MRARPDSTLQRLEDVVARRWRLSASVGAVVLATGAGTVLGLPDLYRATAKILVAPPAPDEAAGTQEARLQLLGHEVLSRSRLLEVAARFGLHARLRKALSEDAFLEQLRRDVRVDPEEARGPDGRSVVTAVAVSCRGTSPGVAAEVANTLASLYVFEESRRRADSAAGLRAQLEEVKGRLQALERSLGPRGVRVAEGGRPSESPLAALERLQGQLRTVAENRMRAMERRTALLERLAASDTRGSADPEAAAARTTSLRQELASLRRRFTDKHPDVRRLAAELAALESQPAPEAGAPGRSLAPADEGLAPLKDALQAVDEEIQVLRDQEEEFRWQAEVQRRRAAQGEPERAARAEPSRDYETTRDLYETLLRRYEEARLAAEGGVSAGGFRILERAVPPADPVAPERLRLVLVALVLALGTGFAAAALAEQADTTFHSVEEVRAFTRVPVLASIPPIGGTWGRGWRRLLTGAVVMTLAVALGHASYRFARASDAAVLMVARGRPS